MFKDKFKDMLHHMPPRTHPDTLATVVDCLITLSHCQYFAVLVPDLYFKYTENCNPALLQKACIVFSRWAVTFVHSIQIILIITSKCLIYLCGALYE